MVGIEVVARLKILVFLEDFAIGHYATTDAGAEGEIEVFLGVFASFAEGAEVGVILDKDRFAEVLSEFLGDIEVSPWKIGKSWTLVIFDDPWHCDAESDGFVGDEIDADLLREVFVEKFLIWDGLKFDRVQDFTSAIDEGNDSFCSTDIDTEIHILIIHLAKRGKVWYNMLKFRVIGVTDV